jgi:molybdenum cofactor cytidylyltransferase
VVLAAGGARRYGGDQKLVAEVPDAEGRRASLVRVAIGQLRRAGLCDVLAVVGHEEERVRSRLEGLGVEIVSNPAHANGMSTSVKAGVRAALERGPETAGILIALGDQPLLDEQIVPRLVDAFESSAGARIVAPRYRGVRGNPVVFSRELADELLAIDGDHGARAVIDRDPARVLTVDFESAAPLDVDTPDDLLRFSGMFDEYQRSH